MDAVAHTLPVSCCAEVNGAVLFPAYDDKPTANTGLAARNPAVAEVSVVA